MKKRLFLCTLLAGSFMWAAAQKGEWQNPEINAVNRAPMHSPLLRLRKRRGRPGRYQGKFKQLPVAQRHMAIQLGQGCRRPAD